MQKITFNDKYGLTKAVLDGQKTMTRRIIPEKNIESAARSVAWTTVHLGLKRNETDFLIDNAVLDHSPIKVGEIVALAERYSVLHERLNDAIRKKRKDDSLEAFHRAGICDTDSGWSNKMFVRADLMPHQIRITNVRVERLQDISDEDCLREGIYLDETAPSCYQPFYTFKESQEHGTPVGYQTAREAFAALIDKISGKGTWDSNPLVFVYEFELVK